MGDPNRVLKAAVPDEIAGTSDLGIPAQRRSLPAAQRRAARRRRAEPDKRRLDDGMARAISYEPRVEGLGEPLGLARLTAGPGPLSETGVVVADAHGRLQWADRMSREAMEVVPLHELLSLGADTVTYVQAPDGWLIRIRACRSPLKINFGVDVPYGAKGRYQRAHWRVFFLERLWGDSPALHRLLVGFGLTARELEITILTVRGLSNKQIARRLVGLSPNSVRDCLRRVFAKVQVQSRAELSARVLRIEFPSARV